MLNKQTLTVVSLNDMLRHMEFRSDEIEAIMDYGFNSVTYGDASYTLIPAWAAIDRIWQGLDSYYWELEEANAQSDCAILSRIYTERELRAELGKLVADTDYIDLEGE